MVRLFRTLPLQAICLRGLRTQNTLHLWANAFYRKVKLICWRRGMNWVCRREIRRKTLVYPNFQKEAK